MSNKSSVSLLHKRAQKAKSTISSESAKSANIEKHSSAPRNKSASGFYHVGNGRTRDKGGKSSYNNDGVYMPSPALNEDLGNELVEMLHRRKSSSLFLEENKELWIM